MAWRRTPSETDCQPIHIDGDDARTSHRQFSGDRSNLWMNPQPGNLWIRIVRTPVRSTCDTRVSSLTRDEQPISAHWAGVRVPSMPLARPTRPGRRRQGPGRRFESSTRPAPGRVPTPERTRGRDDAQAWSTTPSAAPPQDTCPGAACRRGAHEGTSSHRGSFHRRATQGIDPERLRTRPNQPLIIRHLYVCAEGSFSSKWSPRLRSRHFHHDHPITITLVRSCDSQQIGPANRARLG